jgi:hypothetical protein
MERRKFLKGTAAVGLAAGTSAAGVVATNTEAAEAQASRMTIQKTSLARFRKTIPANFDRPYVENAVVPFFLTSLFEGERPLLPMIDLNFSKENALPHDLWALLYDDWKPTPAAGSPSFCRGWRNVATIIFANESTSQQSRQICTVRHRDNVTTFFNRLMSAEFANKPFMRHYLDY